MKEHFKFTTFRKNFIPFMLLMIFAVLVQLYGGGEWSIREVIIGNSIVAAMFIFSTLVVDYIQMKNNNIAGTKKYFKFMEHFHFFVLYISIFTVGNWHNGWSISQIIRSNFTVAVVCVFGSLVIDWAIMKSKNLEE